MNAIEFANRGRRFIVRQFSAVRNGGKPVLMGKVLSLFLLVAALPFALLMRIVYPWLPIRIGNLRSERIGHFVANTELYLCRRSLEAHQRRFLDFFFYDQPPCNLQLAIMWKRLLRIHTFFHSVYRMNSLLPCSERHLVPLWNSRDTDGYLHQTTPHLTFSAEEEEIGAQLLRELGIPMDAEFVCFNARNSLYLETALRSSNWNYHSYRNSTIRNYIPAMEEVCRRGYYAIRMGATVDQPVFSSFPNLIDYASRGRTDFLDIYLLAKCRFFVGDNAGLVAVPEAFRRPYLMVNAIPIENICSWWPQILFIPKKLWLREQERFLSFKEAYATGASRFMLANDYDHLGVTPVENTPEEILDAVVEIDERLRGTWQGGPGEDLLQKTFWNLFPGDRALGKSAFRHGNISTRIGCMFLRQNYTLFDN